MGTPAVTPVAEAPWADWGGAWSQEHPAVGEWLEGPVADGPGGVPCVRLWVWAVAVGGT